MTQTEGESGFVVVKHTRKSPYVIAGRVVREDPVLVFWIDEDGRYEAEISHVRATLLGLGPTRVTSPFGEKILGEQREGGRGFWILTEKARYVIPKRSLLPVLEGDTRKAAVFRYEGDIG